jgi:hypothetical protein
MMIAGYVPRRRRCVRSLATVVLGCVAVQMAKPAPAGDDPREALIARLAIQYTRETSDTHFRLHDGCVEFNPPGPRVAVTAYRFPIRDMLDEFFPPGTTNISKFFTSGGPGAFMFYERDRLFVAVPEDELPMFRATLDALDISTNGVPVKPVPLTEP